MTQQEPAEYKHLREQWAMPGKGGLSRIGRTPSTVATMFSVSSSKLSWRNGTAFNFVIARMSSGS